MADADSGPFDGPRHLQATGRAFWTAMTAEYDFGPHELAVLAEASATLDRIGQFRRALRRKGLTMPGRYGEQIRPEVAAERHARAAFASLVGKLGIPSDEQAVKLPPRSEWSRIVPRRRGISDAQWEAAVRRKVLHGDT